MSISSSGRRNPRPSVRALHAYASARRDHARYYQWSSRMLIPFFQSDRRWLGVMRDAFMGPVGRLPILRREFLATLTGHKTGIVFGRLDQRNRNVAVP
jgi:2-polyprenyl-6-methoxyphenol hydroxylase-like FAD-dependent oxidoreductase